MTKYANMFALSFGYLSEEQKEAVIQNALLNEKVLPITTPYMRFYELAALCDARCYEDVMGFLQEYWGGMLQLGATSFWEAYDASEQGASCCDVWPSLWQEPVMQGARADFYWWASTSWGVRPDAPGYENLRYLLTSQASRIFGEAFRLRAAQSMCSVMGKRRRL